MHNKMTSDKQIIANKENGKLGGVKTDDGKSVSKYNALKHGILKQTVSEYERPFYEELVERLNDQFNPVGVLEKMLVDRIGIYYLKLFRAAKAENEYMQAELNPRKVEIQDPMDGLLPKAQIVVLNEGYTPKLTLGAVEKLSNTYLRYEIAIENRMYKALHELQRVQLTRNGEKVAPPLAVDIDLDRENGFVS